MLSHDEMIGVQEESHPVVELKNFNSIESYILYLKHEAAYRCISSLVKNKKVLEVGCNVGYGSAIMAKFSSEVIGVDVSGKAIRSAKNKYIDSNLSFLKVDGKKLPFADNTFDIIVSFQVIEHIVDYNLFMNELKRVVSKEGLIFFTTPNAYIRLYKGMKPWNRFHVREFLHSELMILLERYFDEVLVLGLFAKEPLYSIDIRRNNRIRDGLKSSSFKKLKVKNKILLLPRLIINNFSYIIRRPIVFDPNFLTEYSIKDFAYETDNLTHALNLMAVCSISKGGLQKIKNDKSWRNLHD